jgi:transcriptional regulator of acetoin/glycerol metabolism
LKNIELHQELTADLPHVRCDSGQIEQIILALVMNARISPVENAVLDHYEWTGNIREPENAIERAMVADREPELGEEDFALRLPVHATSPRPLEDIECTHILAVLEDCNGNQMLAAEALDINRVASQQAEEIWLEVEYCGSIVNRIQLLPLGTFPARP